MKRKIFLIQLICTLSICNNFANWNSVLSENSNIASDSVDNSFKIFIKAFSQDSVFQISRIDFPLNCDYMTDDEDGTMLNKKIEQKEWQIINLDEPDEYGLLIEIGKEFNKQVEVKVNGIDNGIAVNYYFKKISEKWYLVKIIDQSN
jgi:hypothetical protein